MKNKNTAEKERLNIIIWRVKKQQMIFSLVGFLIRAVAKVPFDFDPQNLGLVDFSVGLNNALAAFRKAKILESMEKVKTIKECMGFIENYGLAAHNEMPRSENLIYNYVAVAEYEKAIIVINKLISNNKDFIKKVPSEHLYSISDDVIEKRIQRASERIDFLLKLKNDIEKDTKIFEPIIREKIEISEDNCKKYFGKLIA